MATVEEIIFEGVDRVSTVASGISDKILNVGAVAGAAAISGISVLTSAVISGIGAFNDWAGELDSIGDVLGTTANESATLAVAIDGVGGDVDAITGQMAKLTVGLVDAKGNLGPTGKLLTDMGVSFKDVNGQMLPATDIIRGVADQVSKMPDGLEKSELMMKLFGKSGKDMTDTLTALTTDGLAKAEQKAKDYGLAVGDDGVNASIEMGKSQKDLEMMLKGLSVTIGAEVLPAILPLVQQFAAFAREHLPPLIQGFKDVMGFLGQFAGQVAQVASDSGLIDWFKEAGAEIKIAFDAGREIAEKVWPIIQRILKLIGEIFKAVYGDVKTDSVDMQKTVEDVFKAIEIVITTVMDAIEIVLRVALGIIKGIFRGDWTDIQNMVNDAMAALGRFVQDGMEKVKTAITNQFNEAIAFVEGLPAKFETFGKSIIEGIAEGIRNGAEAVHQALIAFLKNTLPAWAIQLLGISSPSAVFVPMGYQISAGIAKGILDGAGAVYDALQKVTTGNMAISPAMAGRLANNTYSMADTINVIGDMNTAEQIAAARREATRQATLRASVQG